MHFRTCLLLCLAFLASSVSFSADYYWVGGSGSWTDAQHWSQTSGGVGGYGIPGPGDDVFIDDKSITAFNTVITIPSNISVQDFTITQDAGDFTLQSAAAISVHGSIDIQGAFDNQLTGQILVTGFGGTQHHLNFGRYGWHADLYLSSDGEYIMNSGLLFAQQEIHFVKGTLKMNGKGMTADKFISSVGHDRTIHSNGSTFVLSTQWQLDAHNLDVDFSNTRICVYNDDPNAVDKSGLNYTVITPDSNGESMSRAITSIVINDTLVSCGNACDGVLIAQITTDANCGGIIDSIQWYDFSFTPIPGANNDTLTGLCPGLYNVEVFDCDGNVFSAPGGNVLQHPLLNLINENITEPICKDSCDGAVTITVVGGAGPLTYTWMGNPSTTNTATDLCAGPIDVDVSDGVGCDTTFTITITEPDYVVPNVNVIDILCFDECTGSATANPTGGDGNYFYDWTPGGEITPSITNLCDGNYSVLVTDGNGCTGTEAIVVTEPTQVTFDTAHIDISCGGACDGIAGVHTVAGGVGPYTHSWSTGATTDSIFNLCPGVYTDTLRDDNGCDTVITFNITEPPVLTVVMSADTIDCFGICDGIAIGTPGGGTPGYNYTWSTSPLDNDSLPNLCPGQYNLIVTDANGCTVEDSITLTQPNEILIAPTSTGITCFGDCDATIQSNASGGTGTLSYQWYDCGTLLPIGGETNPDINGLCAGSYYVEVTDDNGCVVDNSTACTSFNDPPALTITLGATTNATCGGACDGTASATGLGGTGGLTISWYDCITDALVGTGSPINTLCTGTYYGVVEDANNCTDTTACFTITDLVLVTGVVTANDATCFGFCDGSASVVPAGGSTPYTYEWVQVNPPGGVILNGPNDNISGLCAGDYTVQVFDVNNCASVPIAFTINENPQIIADVTATDVSCFGDCDGTAISNTSGGSGAYIYTWTPAPGVGQGTASASQMCPGTYNLNITDLNFPTCFIDTSIIINEPAPFDFTLTTVDETCTGDCDGTADVVLNSGGTGTITYTWAPAPGAGQGTPNASQMCPGNYTLTIADQVGCDTVINFTINPAPAINLTVTVTANNDCFGDCNGVVQATATGGTGTLTYTWTNNPPVGQGTNTISSLCAGTYAVTVEDQNGCTVQDSGTVTEPTQFTLTSSFTDATCDGVCDGTATVNMTGGGTPGYQYQWDDAPLFQTTPTAVGLCAGNYTCTVSDINGCDTVISFTINAPTAITIVENTSGSTCFGTCTGTADVTVNGGTPNYNIVWFDNATGLPIGQTGTNATNLCPGDYYAEVTDAANCVATSNIMTITEDPEITATITTGLSQCALCTGTADVVAAGGSGTFVNYTWTPAPGAGQGTANATQMCSGIYQVVVLDDNGCSETFTVLVSDAPSETITPDSVGVSCFGGCDGQAIANVVCSDPVCNFQWYDNSLALIPGETNSTLNGQCAGTYIIEVINNSGCASYEDIIIEDGIEILPNESFTDPTCAGAATGTATVAPTGGPSGTYTYNWVPNPPGGQGTASASGLTAGNWSVTITDGACDTTVTFTLTDPPVLDVSNTTTVDVTCFGFNDGIITVFPSGGVGTYTYEWFDCVTSTSIGQTGQQANNLAPGTYYVVVTDQSGCAAQSSPCDTINEPAQLTGTLSSTNVSCNGDCDGTAQVVPVGGINNYNYQWLDESAGGTPIAGGTGDIIANLCPGDYSVDITDLNGCTENISLVTITQPNPYTASVTLTHMDCFSTCDGTADLVIGGATPVYTYTWTPAPGAGQGTANASQMCAGNYSVLVEDLNGCDTTINLTITTPNQIEANATVTQITCNGDNDGAIQTNATGGQGTLSYSWLPGGETTSGISGLGQGTYTVTIQDTTGCFVDTTINLNDPSPITATSFSNSSTCGNSDGSASISPSGGYGTYTITWSPTGGPGPVATGLGAGIYTVTVTDIGGCSEIFLVPITDIGAETVVMDSTDATCFDICDGTATATTACLQPTCLYEWTDTSGNPIGQTTPTATGLCGGIYGVTITNGVGCVTADVVEVLQPTDIIPNDTITLVQCNGDSNGVITLNPTGGNGPIYTYVWTPAPGGGQGTNSATGLHADNWDVLVTDGGGCDTTFSFTINAPTVITATSSFTDVSCQGASDGTASVSATGGTFPYLYQWLDGTMTPIPGETNDFITGLSGGDYFCTITDQSGCTITVGPITITEPTTVTATITGQDVLCNGDCNGVGTVNPSGGTGSYVINWFDNVTMTFTGDTGQVVTTLCPGDYFATVTDASACVFTTAVITIGEPLVLDVTVNATDASCDGICDGAATATVTGGTPGFIYTWLDSQGAPVSGGGGTAVSNLCADSYTIEVIDTNGCTAGPVLFGVQGPTAITGTVFVNDAGCLGADGSATVFAAGGTPGYTYQWYDGSMTLLGGETDSIIQNVFAGTYFLEVTDANNCLQTFTANIGNLNAAVITVDSIIDVSCFGGTDGGAYISVTGTSPPFAYVWNPSGQVGQDLLSVAGGTYTVQVTDAASCIAFETVTINDPTQISASFTITDAACGLCDGEITVSTAGGTGAHTLNWNTGGTTTTISNLCSGTYLVDVTDSLGCVESFTAPVTNAGGPTGESIASNDPSCNGGSDGDATVTPIGGTPPYTYYWLHDGGTTNTATNLATGTYYLQVTDSNSCVRTVEVIIGEPTAITDIPVITPATCGACDGEITVAGSGGAGAPYGYQWIGGPAASTYPNLCEGIYFLEITDANTCVDTFTYAVNGANAPTVTLTPTDASCDGNCDGSIVSDTSGGTQPMAYQWMDGQGNPIAGETNDNITGLCTGDYILEVTDGAGCLSYAQTTIGGPSSFEFSLPTVFDVSCAGGADGEAHVVVIGGTLPYVYTWTPPPGAGQGTSSGTGMTSGTYDVEVQDANGCLDTQQVVVNEPLPLALAIDSVQNALCWDSNDGFIEITVSGGTPTYNYAWTSDPAGYTSSQEDPDSLFAMDYIVTVTDANNCTLTDTLSVDTTIAILANAGPDTAYCEGNQIDIIGTGTGSTGLTYTWYDDSTNVIDNDSLLTVNEPAGVYTYILEVTFGPCSHLDTVVVTVNALPVVDAGADIDIVNGASTTIGGSPTAPSGSTIVWSPDFFISDTTGQNPIVTPDTTTVYSVAVTDSNGCTGVDTIVVGVFPAIIFPNGFSPNGDGVNDTWQIDFIQQFPDAIVEVYNRWGTMLFRSIGYVEEWDAMYNGEPLPIGTYYYIIDLEHPLYPDVFTGPITILR